MLEYRRHIQRNPREMISVLDGNPHMKPVPSLVNEEANVREEQGYDENNKKCRFKFELRFDEVIK